MAVLSMEKKAGRSYLKRSRRKIYLALEDLDFTWDEPEVEQFGILWERGLSVARMADIFKRDPDELAILAMDQARKGRIQYRSSGVLEQRKVRSND